MTTASKPRFSPSLWIDRESCAPDEKWVRPLEEPKAKRIEELQLPPPKVKARTFEEFSKAIFKEVKKHLDLDSQRRKEAVREGFRTVAEIVRFTSEIFACDVMLKEDFDPEFPEDRYFVFIVEPRAAVDTLVAKEQEWVKKLRNTFPDRDEVRLSIRPRE